MWEIYRIYNKGNKILYELYFFNFSNIKFYTVLSFHDLLFKEIEKISQIWKKSFLRIIEIF